jgi:AcrR family transcriptional regulator
MSPRSHQQFEALRQKSREAILDAALRLFARQGYAQTTIAEIAKRARISKGLIYNHFTSKEEILECLVAESMEKAFPMLNAPADGVEPQATLEEFIHTWFQLIRSDSDLFRLSYQLHTSGDFKKLVQHKQEELAHRFMRGLTIIFKRLGSPHPDMDTLILGSILDGIGLNYTAAPAIYPLDRVELHLVRHCCLTRKGMS